MSYIYVECHATTTGISQLYRCENMESPGEYWSENRWKPSTPPSMGWCVSGSQAKLWVTITLFEAVEKFPEAFQQEEVKYCTHGSRLYFYTNENDLGTFWSDGKWNKSTMLPPMAFLIKDHRAEAITKEEAIKKFPKAFEDNEKIHTEQTGTTS